MIPTIAVLALVAVVGVCTISRWCSEMQDEIDALRGRHA